MVKLFSMTLSAFLALFISCTSVSQCTNCGIIVYKASFYNPDLLKYVNKQTDYTDIKIWYRDSSVIEQITGIHLGNISVVSGRRNGPEQRWTEVLGYIFISLPTHSFYRYYTFTDTATLIKHYTQADSAEEAGGWNFYAPRHLASYSAPIRYLSDTTVEGVAYRRIMLTRVVKVGMGMGKPLQVTVPYICYLRCDKKGSMFDMDKDIGEKMGCPMVKIQELPVEGYPHPILAELVYEANNLTPEEIKVFDTWEKYAKAHPVVKTTTK